MTMNGLEQALRNKESGTTGKGLERAQAILEAAVELFSTRGHSAFSMRAVAARVGVSLSVVQHYYRSKDALLEGMLIYLMDGYQAAIDQITGAMAGASQADRYLAAMEVLLEAIRLPRANGCFPEIWALARCHPFAAELVGRAQARERKAIHRLIRGMVPGDTREQYETRAALIAAYLEGLILYYSRNPAAPAGAFEAEAREGFLRLARCG